MRDYTTVTVSHEIRRRLEIYKYDTRSRTYAEALEKLLDDVGAAEADGADAQEA